jgi:hypothetical protein
MAQAKRRVKAPTRRSYSQEFNEDAVQMRLDGHAAVWVAERLGLSGPIRPARNNSPGRCAGCNGRQPIGLLVGTRPRQPKIFNQCMERLRRQRTRSILSGGGLYLLPLARRNGLFYLGHLFHSIFNVVPQPNGH